MSMVRRESLVGLALLAALALNATPAAAQVESSSQEVHAYAGVGAKYFATDRVIVRLEARYRYLDGIVDEFDDSLSTVETTLGVGWKF